MVLYTALFSWLLATTPVATGPSLRPPAADAEFCQIFGAVYLERDPRQRGFCAFAAYEEPDEAFADLAVFKEDNRLFADQSGLWYIAPSRAFADYVVFVTPTRGQADFSIFYTPTRSFAGCRR
jgi:hypothetical protein